MYLLRNVVTQAGDLGGPYARLCCVFTAFSWRAARPPRVRGSSRNEQPRLLPFIPLSHRAKHHIRHSPQGPEGSSLCPPHPLSPSTCPYRTSLCASDTPSSCPLTNAPLCAYTAILLAFTGFQDSSFSPRPPANLPGPNVA